MVRWEADFYYTEKLHIDGQHELAAARFAALQAEARTPHDADDAGLMACETQARGGDPAAGSACYDALAVAGFGRDVRMRALLHAAELRLYDLGKPKEGLLLCDALVRKAPDTAAALRALDHLTLEAQKDAGRREAAIARFLHLEQADPTSDMADNLLLRAAMLLEGEGSRKALATAVTLLERHEKHHHEDATAMDAMTSRARILGKLGRLHEEARDLERIVLTYETSYVFASYVLEAHKVAAGRLIELYRGPLLNLKRAEQHARHLPEMLRKPLKMPAYFATLAEIQEQRGNLRGALHTWRDLLAAVKARHADMRENDERICDELDARAATKACLDEVRSHPFIDPAEVPRAHREIARLEAVLAGGQRRADAQGGAP